MACSIDREPLEQRLGFYLSPSSVAAMRDVYLVAFALFVLLDLVVGSALGKNRD